MIASLASQYGSCLVFDAKPGNTLLCCSQSRSQESYREHKYSQLVRESQGRKNATQTAITVLKRVDFQEDDNKHGNDQQGMQTAKLPRLIQPGGQLSHATRYVEWCGCLEHTANHIAGSVKAPTSLRSVL